MIERLDRLTVSQFVDLACGDYGILLSDGEKACRGELAEAAKKILLEYKAIADPAGMKTYMLRTEELTKARMTLVIMNVCKAALDAEKSGAARELLTETGVNAARMSDERLRAEVMSRAARARKTIADFEEDDESAQGIDIRSQFDEQSVAMMAHFRFQMDPSVMSATIYARLVARYVREMKAMERARNKG